MITPAVLGPLPSALSDFSATSFPPMVSVHSFVLVPRAFAFTVVRPENQGGSVATVTAASSFY
jgi:hypothetical protein